MGNLKFAGDIGEGQMHSNSTTDQPNVGGTPSNDVTFAGDGRQDAPRSITDPAPSAGEPSGKGVDFVGSV